MSFAASFNYSFIHYLTPNYLRHEEKTLVSAIDWQLLALSFVTVFLAEIGDKSQLAAIALSGSSRAPRAVFIGATVALLLASFIGVLIGGGVAQILPTRTIKIMAAVGFAFLGLRILWCDWRNQE